jgi:prepilin-type N-terminal cleavage/methylation domain-containing protein
MRALGRWESADAGFTLIELAVTMVIMTVVLIVALGSFSTIFVSQTRQTSISNSESQLALAFITLDNEVRYSTGITEPDQDGGSYYVEFQYFTPSNTSQCAELQYSPTSGTLSQRTWPVPASGSEATPGSWDPLATDLSTAGQPFALVNDVGGDTSDDLATMEQLQVDLTATAGKGSGQASSTSVVIFTAVDTTNNNAASVCTGVSPS